MARILYFSRDYTTHDHRFLSALAQTEHQVHYLRLERGGRQLEDRSLPPEIEVIPWAGGQAPARWQDGLRLLRDLKRVIRSVQPDLIQAGPLQRAAFLVALAGFQPLVSMSWGYDLIRDAGRNALWRWATRYTLKHSAVMIGDCQTIRQLAVAHGMPAERIVTFPWGVDLTHFSPDNHRLPESGAFQPGGTFTILSTRGWEPLYGVDVIARAFVQVAKQRPGLRLMMLGTGSQAAELRQIFLNGNVLDQVVFPGQISQRDLPRYYRGADLYVSASHSDGSSISLLEAMACGLPVVVSDIPGNREWVQPGPVVVSDIPGNREWVQPGVNGWWFRDGDAGALTQALLQAVNDRDELSDMGRAARQIVEQRANWNENFQKLLKVYESVLRAP